MFLEFFLGLSSPCPAAPAEAWPALVVSLRACNPCHVGDGTVPAQLLIPSLAVPKRPCGGQGDPPQRQAKEQACPRDCEVV